MRIALLAVVLCAAPASAQAFRITVPLDRAPEAPRLDGRALAEMGAIALTGVGQLVASEAGVSNLYIPVVIVGWGGYVGARALGDPGFLGELGFTGDHLGRATRDVAIVSAVAAGGMAAYGLSRGSTMWEPSLVPLLALYPVWGLTQQMLVQGFLTRHLDAAGLPTLAVAPVTAAAFGSVHVPNWPLTGATTALGGAFAPLYLRDRNLWPLGVAHGALGALFYVWVLDEDPWEEALGRE